VWLRRGALQLAPRLHLKLADHHKLTGAIAPAHPTSSITASANNGEVLLGIRLLGMHHGRGQLLQSGWPRALRGVLRRHMVLILRCMLDFVGSSPAARHLVDRLHDFFGKGIYTASPISIRGALIASSCDDGVHDGDYLYADNRHDKMACFDWASWEILVNTKSLLHAAPVATP